MTTAKAHSSAHVCTPRLAPVIGEMALVGDEIDIDALKARWRQSFALFRQPILDGIPNALLEPTPPANWAGQHPVVLLPTPRTTDAMARHCYDADLSHCHHLIGGDRLQHTARRRGCDLPDGIWDCSEYRNDALGHVWTRHYTAVTDDFGWLVEVPEC